MASVTLHNVAKVYPGGVRAVDGICLDIADREFIVLVGPSGCGKSTTLRMIAGLEDISAGTIRIGERVVNDVAPKDRDIAMVFQNYALYPHMTVYKNMAFSLKLRRRELGLSRSDIDKKVRETAGVLGIVDLLDRKPRALSGGQRQRVAVGRAIVRNPKVFLFDEPLSNLDAKLRMEMRSEIKRLQRRFQTTTVYVTHDQEEAMTLGDRVVVMKDGHVHQVAPPLEIYERPANRFVAGFIGTPTMNFLDGQIVQDAGQVVFDEGSIRLPLPARLASAVQRRAGQPMVLGIRPDAMDGAAAQRGVDAHWPRISVHVDLIEPLGDRKDVYVRLPSQKTMVGRFDARVPAQEGRNLDVFIDMSRAHVFEPGELGASVSAAGVPAVMTGAA